jgi:outer membrane protein TolC
MSIRSVRGASPRLALALGLGLCALPALVRAQSAEPQTIDLPAALRLAGIDNLDLALVREAQQRAKAANDAATLRFFPWLELGASYDKHTGAEQVSPPGDVQDFDTVLYEPAASLNAQLDLGDAIFQKLAARQQSVAAGYNVEAQRNDTVLAAAGAYFDLVDAAAAEDIARDALRIAQDYEQQLDRAFAIGLTNRSEVLRESVQTQREQVLLREAQNTLRAAGTALATLLHLDALVQLQPAERMVTPPTLVPLDTPESTLADTALSTRPELKGSAAAIQAAQVQQRGARYGPLIPSLGAQAIYGLQRGGPGNYFGFTQSSRDYVIGLNWRLGPGGLLDFSRTEAADSQLRTQRLGDAKLRDAISAQVIDAYEGARTRWDQIGLARRSVELAEQSLRLSQQRREFGVYAVLEVIQAQQDLTQARRDYASALTQYAKAQYALAHATARIGGSVR